MNRDVPEYKYCNENEFEQQIKKRIEELKEYSDIPLTPVGNPFVDTGILTICIITGKKPMKITLGDALSSFTNIDGKNTYGKEFAKRNAAIKSINLVFGNNAPLSQVAYGKLKHKNPCLVKASKASPSPLQEQIYRSYLVEFLVNYALDNKELNNNSNNIPHCIICGKKTNMDFNKIENKIYEIITGITNSKSKKREFGSGPTKQWFPLLGSIGSEAQSLPTFTEPQTICGGCLFTVHFLPQVCNIVSGGLQLYQSNDYSLILKIISPYLKKFDEIYTTSDLNKPLEILGKEAGYETYTMHLLDTISSHGNPANLIIWSFSNFGTGTKCSYQLIPNETLEFIIELYNNTNGRKQIEKFIKTEQKLLKHPDRFFINRITQKVDYEGFYVESNIEPPDEVLYTYYQVKIIGWTSEILNLIKKISRTIRKNTKDKDLERLYKEFKSKDLYPKIYRTIIDIATDKNIADKTIKLFNANGKKPLNLFKFYLHPKYKDNTNDIQIIENSALKINKKILENISIIKFIVNKSKNSINHKKLSRYEFSDIMNHFIKITETEIGCTWHLIDKLNKNLNQREIIFYFKLLYLNDTESIIAYKPQYNITLDELIKQSGLHKETINGLTNYIQIRGIKKGLKKIIKELTHDLKYNNYSANYLFDTINNKLKENEKTEISEYAWFTSQLDKFGEFSWFITSRKLRVFLNQYLLVYKPTLVQQIMEE